MCNRLSLCFILLSGVSSVFSAQAQSDDQANLLAVQALVKEALASCNITRQITLQEGEKNEVRGPYLLTLSPLLDSNQFTLDRKRAAIYHECGHLYYSPEHQQKSRISTHQAFIQTVIGLATLLFAQHTSGLTMLFHYGCVLAATSRMNILIASRSIELQADTFAYEQLFKNGHSDSVLAWIWDHQTLLHQSLFDKIVTRIVENFLHMPSDHPTHQERAVAARIFLESKGIDVDQALAEYLKKVGHA